MAADSDFMSKVTLWVRIAGLTAQDIPSQKKCLHEEMIVEWREAKTFDEFMDAYVDADWVRLVLYSLGYKDYQALNTLLDMWDNITAMFEPTDKHFDALDAAIAWREKVVEANFAKFCKTRAHAAASSQSLANLGIANYAHIGRDYECNEFYVLKSAKDQQVGDKYYPRDKILKPLGWEQPE